MQQHYVGLDVSLDQTSLCVLDGTGRVVSEAKLDTDPEAIAAHLHRAGFAVERLGLEAGPLSQ
jgi:predicted NBD/HSP70 family sugar kinase